MSHCRRFASLYAGTRVGFPGLFILALLTAGLLGSAVAAHAFGVNECPASRKGSNLGCTAGDVSITGIAVAPGGPTSCVGGATFPVDLDITVNFATPDRWDIGIFLSEDGKDPQTLPGSGGAATCAVGILPIDYPFMDLDSNGGTDTCGDGNGTINEGLGYGFLRMTNVPVLCQAINLSGGNLYVPFVVSWDNQASPAGGTCTSIADPVPNTVSKCNAPNTSLPVEVAYGTVNTVVLPAITKTDGKASVSPGDASTYTVVITNTTGVPLSNAVFTDPAVPNLNVGSVTCSPAGGATCPAITVAAMQGAGVTIPPMPVASSVTFTINATVANPVVPAYAHLVTNTAFVTVGPLGPSPPANRQTNSATDTDTINGAVYTDLSTSTKAVVDLNGGDARPGDVLRYTITLTESAGITAASGVSVTDSIPANVDPPSNISIPAGAAYTWTAPPGGTYGNGRLDVTGITVPAGGSVTVVFDVIITSGTPAGTTIDNRATITNPLGPGATPSAPQIVVSASDVPITANKRLYAQPPTVSGILAGPLRRIPSTVNPLPANLYRLNGVSTATFTLTPVLQAPMSFTSGYRFVLQMFLQGSTDRVVNFNLKLQYRLGGSTVILANRDVSRLITVSTLKSYSFNFPDALLVTTVPQNAVLELLVTNKDFNRDIRLYPYNPTQSDTTRVGVNSATVINVDSIGLFSDVAYPGGVALTSVAPGDVVRIRTTVSDPFGSADITSAKITLTDPSGTVILNQVDMGAAVYDSGAATKVYEYRYTVPGAGPTGTWRIRVDSNEGTEGTVSDYAIRTMPVAAPLPALTFLKFSQVERDPVNGTGPLPPPVSIPGADMLYTLQVSNSGAGTADSVYFKDPIPTNTKLFVNNLGQGGPVTFSDPDTDSGFAAPPPLPFTLNYYSDAACTSAAAPSPDADGFDANIRCLRINMTGTMSGAVTPVTPDFSLTFRVRIL